MITQCSWGILPQAVHWASRPVALLCALITILPASASADVPKKAPLVKYTGLWTNSPFTSKPVVDPTGPMNNPLDDFTLTGIAPVPGGYRITIMNKKNPDVKRVIEPGGTDKEFKVVSVNRNPGKTLGTTVVLSSGSMQGTVSFEPDLITLKAAPAAAPQNPQQANGNLPPGITPAMANQQNANQQNGNQADANNVRQPRPRIVPPPAPAAPAAPAEAGTATQRGTRENRDSRSPRRR